MAGGATFSCDSCGKQYPWKAELANKKAKCKCGAIISIPAKPTAARAPVRAAARAPVAAPAIPVEAAEIPVEESQSYRCPACKADLAPGSAICISCGYNLQTGEYVNTQVDSGDDNGEVEAPKKKKKKKAAAATTPAAKTGQPSATNWIGMGKTKKEREAALAADKSSTMKQVTIVIALAIVVVGVVFAAKYYFKNKGGDNDPALANLPGSDAEAMRMLKNDDPVEAKEFIESHATRSLGVTWTQGKAKGMIQRWYDMGAVNCWAFQGQISRHVVIELPQDPAKRKELLDWASVFEDETLKTVIKDEGQKYLILHMR